MPDSGGGGGGAERESGGTTNTQTARLHEEGHGKVGQPVRPGQLEGDVGAHAVVAGEEARGEALVLLRGATVLFLFWGVWGVGCEREEALRAGAIGGRLGVSTAWALLPFLARAAPRIPSLL